MSARKYRRAKKGQELRKGNSKRVLYWEDKNGRAVQLNCPCGKRLVYVTEPPHTITFGERGRLDSLGGSCGYRPKPDMDPPRPANWCHFTIENGVASMHDDAKCPGGDGSIP